MSSELCWRLVSVVLGCTALLMGATAAATTGGGGVRESTTTTSTDATTMSCHSSGRIVPSSSSSSSSDLPRQSDHGIITSSGLFPEATTTVAMRPVDSQEGVVNSPSSSDSIDAISKSRTIKVCVLVEPSPFHYVSGYSGRFQNLVLHLKARGDYVQVVVPATNVLRRNASNSSGRHSTSEVWNGVPVHYMGGVRLAPWYPDLVVSIEYAFRIPRILWTMKPDLIHVSSPGFLVFAAVVYGRLFRIPVIASYHTHLPVYVQSHYLPKPLRKLAAFVVWQLIRMVHGYMVDMTVVTSPQIRDEFIQHGVPAHHCHVWRKGIDPDTFHPHHACAEMRNRITNHHPDDFVLLYVGRLSVEKRLALLRPVLDRLDRLNHNSSNSTTTRSKVRLCFVGSGPQEGELRTLFDGTPTVFTGVLTGRELSQAFASADVFVMPSDSETLGFVVLEAMASGVVPVVAQAGGLVDLVEHGTTGFLVETTTTSTPDHDEFAERFASYVHQLQHDVHLRRSMGQQARDETLKWSWSASMESLRETEYKLAMERIRDRWDQRLWRFLTWQR